MSFTVIETQEQLNEIIKDRLSREQEKHSKELADLQKKLDDLTGEHTALQQSMQDKDGKYAALDTEIADLRKKVSDYETTSAKRKIADEYKLPAEIAARIQGADEKEWRQDAEALSKFMKQTYVPPLATNEPAAGGDDKAAAFRQMLQEMKGE